MRYVGLYHTQRGAHTFFFKVKEVQRSGEYVVNLLHYEDAASLAVAVLQRGGELRGKAFIGCDNHPVSFQVRRLCSFISAAFNEATYAMSNRLTQGMHMTMTPPLSSASRRFNSKRQKLYARMALILQVITF